MKKIKIMRKNMYFIWLVLAIFCLIYYIICAGYAGRGSSFISMWLLMAIVFGIIFVIFRLACTNVITVPKFIIIAFWSIFILGLSLFIFIEALIVSEMTAKAKIPHCDYVVVLGAQIRGHTITKSLKKRLDTAYEYCSENEAARIIVSGGRGEGEYTSEAYAMKQYLVSRGIKEQRIIMEDESFNTAQNFENSSRYIDDTNARVGVVTSNFHMYRALRLAKGVGLANTYGIPSDSDEVLLMNYMLRESAGIIKDFLQGNF